MHPFTSPQIQGQRKYLMFHVSGQTYKFKALPFDLVMATLEFTKVVTEMKVMADSKGIRIHHYLDDWLLRAPCQETCLQHTESLLAR